MTMQQVPQCCSASLLTGLYSYLGQESEWDFYCKPGKQIEFFFDEIIRANHSRFNIFIWFDHLQQGLTQCGGHWLAKALEKEEMGTVTHNEGKTVHGDYMVRGWIFSPNKKFKDALAVRVKETKKATSATKYEEQAKAAKEQQVAAEKAQMEAKPPAAKPAPIKAFIEVAAPNQIQVPPPQRVSKRIPTNAGLAARPAELRRGGQGNRAVALHANNRLVLKKRRITRKRG
jgi:hypothetical protein